MKWTPSWIWKWTMWHGRNRSNVMFLFVSPSPSDIPWENMNRDFVFWGGDWVPRPFNQRFGQEAHDGLDAAVKTVRDMASSLRLEVDADHREAGWAANMGSIVVVRRSTEDVVCLFMLLAVQMCMITLPPVIMEVENGVLADVLSLQMGHFPLPWLWEVFCLFLPYSLWEFLIRFERYSLGPEKQTSDYVGDVTQQGIASSYHALICAAIRCMRFWPR